MKQITLNQEQTQKLKKFLSDALEWTDAIESSETLYIDRSNCSDRSFYTRNYDRIAKEDHIRKEQIKEIKEILGL
jgi:hypothetical protein